MDESSASLEDPACEEGHDLTMVTSVHLVCDRCGSTSQTIPDGLSSTEWAWVQFEYRATPT